MVRIVDASVAIKWFIEEPGHEVAIAMLEELIEKPRNFAVPELFFFELFHVFHRILPRATNEQFDLLTTVVELPIQRFSMTRELLEACSEFQKMGLSGYDSAYVGLAKVLKGQWVTFDSKAHAVVRHTNLSKLLLAQ
ncbi:MAG: type II toxin-antitoxin system VapC family toxin [Deltaproteobacteria bacterium]|nr:type II toxin-antitoxin system VapC family toxin [Deltaproteobacteria bacterium]MBI3295728.1 type II toxin-antitoxin system VapC family toxin [Deltaproteobacteria bacterium]